MADWVSGGVGEMMVHDTVQCEATDQPETAPQGTSRLPGSLKMHPPGRIGWHRNTQTKTPVH